MLKVSSKYVCYPFISFQSFFKISSLGKEIKWMRARAREKDWHRKSNSNNQIWKENAIENLSEKGQQPQPHHHQQLHAYTHTYNEKWKWKTCESTNGSEWFYAIKFLLKTQTMQFAIGTVKMKRKLNERMLKKLVPFDLHGWLQIIL